MGFSLVQRLKLLFEGASTSVNLYLAKAMAELPQKMSMITGVE